MPDVVFTVDQARSMRDQAVPGHNRWHPDIPPAVRVRPGQSIRVECREWTDNQIGNNDSANDVRDVDLSHAHMLSGPIYVEGAEPGDLLVVDILDLGPVPQEVGDAPGQGWGYTGIFAKANGGGFLTDHFPDAYKAIWDFSGQKCTSRHIPGVEFTGITHPGLFGTAPSPELLARWNAREQALIDTDPDADARRWRCPRWRNRCSAAPRPATSWPGSARTARAPCPPRENGGNHDIKNFTRGSRVFYPVHVPGALFSGGDLHFSQGDGEITFCGAIEMGGFIDFHVDLIKGGMETYGVTTNPILMPGNVEPRYSEFVTFIGIGVDHDTDTQLYNDATVAYRNACLNAVTYLQEVRLLRAAGLSPPRRRTDRGPGQWRRRHPERVLLALPPDGDLRLRHPTVGVRTRQGRPRELRGLVVAVHPCRFGRVVVDLPVLDAVDPAGPQPFGRADSSEVGHVVGDGVEHQIDGHSREVRADAEMGACSPKPRCGLGLRKMSNRVRVFEDVLVEVGGSVEHHHPLPLLDLPLRPIRCPPVRCAETT